MDAPMRTLIFCTAWSASSQQWELRYRPWLDHARASGIAYDLLLIIDDASQRLPSWIDCPIKNASDGEIHGREALVTFDTHLGRAGSEDSPGWYRSFAYALSYATKHGFDKVIHVESDAALISQRAIARMNLFAEGWLSLWTPRYNFPEMAIQVIAGTSLGQAQVLFSEDYGWLRGTSHEWAMPFTEVDKSLQGDRYGEAQVAVPLDADFATQIDLLPVSCERWWLVPSGITTSMLTPHARIRNLLAGWSNIEDGFVWSLGRQSQIAFQRTGFGERYCIQIDVEPALCGSRIVCQEAGFSVGSMHLGTMLLFQRETFRFIIDAGAALAGNCILTISHPGCFRPCDLNSESGDDRPIAIKLYSLDVYPVA
jgi:hypothetical protein